MNSDKKISLTRHSYPTFLAGDAAVLVDVVTPLQHNGKPEAKVSIKLNKRLFIFFYFTNSALDIY